MGPAASAYASYLLSLEPPVRIWWERGPCPDRPELTEARFLRCEWGRFRNTELTDRRPLDRLMLGHVETISRLLLRGPEPNFHGGGVVSASIHEGRVLAHLDRDGRRWTWRMFPASRETIKGPTRLDRGLLVGVWPD